jgi:hypothetical protein
MRLAITLFLVAVTGCVGDISDPGDGTLDQSDDGDDSMPGDKQGPAAYKNGVHTIMGRCSGGSCHSIGAASAALSKFYDPDATTAYNAAVLETTLIGTFQQNAPIIAKINTTPLHNGATYTTAEISSINAWLTAETTDRAGDDPDDPPPPAVDALAELREFSGCTTIADFEAAGMALAWGGMIAESRQCASCHSQGLGNFIANVDSAIMFQGMSTQMDLYRRFFTFGVPAQGGAETVIINTGSFSNAGLDGGITSHPRFDPLSNQGMTALLSLYQIAKPKYDAGTCGPPTLPPTM